jgi:hypothetical protein
MPSYSLITNCTRHTDVLFIKWDLMYYVGIFGVPIMSGLDILETFLG